MARKSEATGRGPKVHSTIVAKSFVEFAINKSPGRMMSPSKEAHLVSISCELLSIIILAKLKEEAGFGTRPPICS